MPASGLIGSEQFSSTVVESRITELEHRSALAHFEQAELDELYALRDEAQPLTDSWESGTTLVREDYFPAYAHFYARDIGRIEDEGEWPYDYIDWQAAADDLRTDFASLSFRGATYWLR